LYPFLAFGNNPDNPYNNIFSVYQRALSPLVKLFNPGKEAEMNEHIVGMGEKMAVYGQKLAELQQHIYATAAQSWETFVLENYEQVKKGADLSNTQEAFQKWINRNEEVFIGLFRSEEYSKLQGELLDLGLEIRQHAEKAGEIVLQPFPVVLRSEADDLYTTVYELRKRISALEKQQQESETETKEPKSSAKKKTATV
ncbi:MAG TPA: poly(R)-hydroxyalkanoic acid synthase subunit PhaE, partial [Bacteroidia bacterium]|nr:poly(R)-hydroxyalkanoic acid synthase subunit PhaE [Bacteroidia bacterium]